MVARLDGCHAGADLADDAGALMAEDGGKDPLAIEAIKRIGIGMTDSGRLDFDQDLAGLRAFQVDLDDFKRFLRFESDGGACLHS